MLAIFNNAPEGPVLNIGLSAPPAPGVIPAQPPANTVFIKAIADTGASNTCISATAAQRAGLPVIGKGNVQSASHVTAVNLYLGDLWIGGRNVGGSPFFWRFANRVFTELGLSGAQYEALLGMDIFREGVLMVHGPMNQTTFAW